VQAQYISSGLIQSSHNVDFHCKKKLTHYDTEILVVRPDIKTDKAHLLAQRDCEWMFPATRIKKGKKVSQSFKQLLVYNSAFLSRIHKRTISLRFLGIILRIL
jgi:hypothetical protein